MNRKRYEELKKLADKGEVAKLNVHSVFRQKEITVKYPRCGDRFILKLEVNERSSAVFLQPSKKESVS